jgi:hypothetical protein
MTALTIRRREWWRSVVGWAKQSVPNIEPARLRHPGMLLAGIQGSVCCLVCVQELDPG